MPRVAGTEAIASREDVVIRAFRNLLVTQPGGWYSSEQLISAIALDLGKPKSGSTVRETWRLGRNALLKQGYLGTKSLVGPRGPEIRFYLRYIDGKLRVPYRPVPDRCLARKESGFSPPGADRGGEARELERIDKDYLRGNLVSERSRCVLSEHRPA